jgi:hypothetical protein
MSLSVKKKVSNLSLQLIDNQLFANKSFIIYHSSFPKTIDAISVSMYSKLVFYIIK